MPDQQFNDFVFLPSEGNFPPFERNSKFIAIQLKLFVAIGRGRRNRRFSLDMYLNAGN
ncbi:hypothetical protein D3C73_1416790 [compost metagenome]